MRRMLSISTLLALAVFFTASRQQIGETCLVYKVVYNNGIKIDSILLQETHLDAQQRPIFEIEYFEDGLTVNFRTKYLYKKDVLKHVIVEDSKKNTEQTSYTYFPLGKISKIETYSNGKKNTVQEYAYVGNKLSKISNYRYETKKRVLEFCEFRLYESGKIINEIVTNNNGDTTFRGVYNYITPNTIEYKAYGSDGKELESYRGVFANDSIILNKTFFQKGEIVYTETYTYDFLQRLIKKELTNNKGEIVESEEYLYDSKMLLRATKVDHREKNKEVTVYDEKNGKTRSEEFWRNDKLEIRLYYVYSGAMAK